MDTFRLLVAIALVALMGCSHAKPPTRLQIAWSGEDDCVVRMGGRSIRLNDLGTVARQQNLTAAPVIISADEAVPYRCIGGVIYALQIAGAKRIEFKAAALPAQ